MKTKKENDSEPRRNTFPHSCLSVHDCRNCHSKCKSENCTRDEYTKPEKEIFLICSRWFLRFEWFARKLCKEHLNRVADVQQTGHLDSPRNRHCKLCMCQRTCSVREANRPTPGDCITNQTHNG